MSEAAALESNDIPENASPEARRLIVRLNNGLNLMIDRNEALQTELALAQKQLRAMFDGNVGVGVLQEIALDPTQEPSLRAKCAGLLLQTEKPKLSAVMTTTAPQKLTDIFKRVEAQGKVIEQAPAPNPAA
jgi:hypothetical protein